MKTSNFYHFSEFAQQNVELERYLIFGESPDEDKYGIGENIDDDGFLIKKKNNWYCSD